MAKKKNSKSNKKKKKKRNKKPKQNRKKKPNNKAKPKKKTVRKTTNTVKPDPAAISKGLIGNIGKAVVFQVSSEMILTFSSLSRTVKGRWASHARIGKKPMKQFLGPDSSSITLTVTLDAQHGVKPRTTAENIAKLITRGEPQAFVVGGRVMGTYVITEMSEAWERVLNRGEAVRIVCSLTLEEYA